MMLWETSLNNVIHQVNSMLILVNQTGLSRIKRDNSDLKGLIEWFDAHEPFDPRQPLLQSIASGITVLDEDDVNCDEAEKVGFLI